LAFAFLQPLQNFKSTKQLKDKQTQMFNQTEEYTSDSSTASIAGWATFWIFCSVSIVITCLAGFYDDYQYKQGNKQRYDGLRPESQNAV
jgi:hypothetical protein